MTWARIDDQFFYNKKVAQVDGSAKLLYLAGLVYAANQLTDGLIPERALRFIASTADVANCQDFAKQLLDVGLWDATDEGYMIHDYLDWNPSKEQVEETRRVRAQSGKQGGLAKAAHSQQNAKQNPSKEVAKSQQKSAPSPSPSLGVNNDKLGKDKGVNAAEPPPPPPASESVTFAREQASRLSKLNAQVAPALRTPLANVVLDMTGKRALADAGGAESDRLLLAAHEAAVTLYQMGVKSESALLALEPAWRDDWRGCSGGTAKQLLEFVSEQQGGKQKSRSNGNGRITDYTTADEGDWLPEKPAEPDQSEQIERILAVLRPRLRLEDCTAALADDGALVLSVASQEAADVLKQHSNLIANTVAQHIQTRIWRCEVRQWTH